MKKILEAKLLEKILKIFHNSNYIIANHFNVLNIYITKSMTSLIYKHTEKLIKHQA